MRLTRACCLVAVTLVGVTIAGGTSTALAEGPTALCQNNELPCAEKAQYGKGTIIEASTNNLPTFILTETLKITCQHSGFEIELTQALGEPLEASIVQYTLEECFWGTSECSVTAEPYEPISFLREESKALGTGEMNITVSCPIIGECVIAASPFWPLSLFSTTEEEAAKLWVYEILFELQTPKLSCPKFWIIHSINEITSPKPLYVSS
jgi:hypothetical protein